MAKYEQWYYRFKFLEGIKLHWMFHAGFWEFRDFLSDVIQSIQILGFGNIKRIFRRFAFVQANIFFLKLKGILTKIDILFVKS